MKVAAKKAESEVGKDATVPQASQALTADAVAKMISDAFMARDAAATGKRADAVVAKDKDHDAALQAATTRANERMRKVSETFAAHVKSCGYRLDAANTATATALTVVKSHAPAMLPVAERAANTNRLDDLKAIFDAAEDARRESLLSDQFAVVEHLHQTVAGEVPAAAARLTHSQLVTRA
jgi:hypothetical protein